VAHNKTQFRFENTQRLPTEIKNYCLQALNEIELDIAELDIYQITSSPDIPVAYFDVLQKNDKLIIKLGRTFYKNNTIDLDIRYSAGYYSRDGVQKIRNLDIMLREENVSNSNK
jgi:hypothetical protein